MLSALIGCAPGLSLYSQLTPLRAAQLPYCLACIRFTPRFRSHNLNSFERLAFLIPIFGWFHALIAYGNSLHHQYFGTRAGFGLRHAFDLLQRKILNAPSVQGDFHYHFPNILRQVIISSTVGVINKDRRCIGESLSGQCPSLIRNSMVRVT